MAISPSSNRFFSPLQTSLQIAETGFHALNRVGQTANAWFRYITCFALLSTARSSCVHYLFKRGDKILTDKPVVEDEFWRPCNISDVYAFVSDNPNEIGTFNYTSTTKLPENIQILGEGSHRHNVTILYDGWHNHKVVTDEAGVIGSEQSLTRTAGNDQGYKDLTSVSGNHTHEAHLEDSGGHTHPITGGDKTNHVPRYHFGCKEAKKPIAVINETCLNELINQTSKSSPPTNQSVEEIWAKIFDLEGLFTQNQHTIETISSTTSSIYHLVTGLPLANETVNLTSHDERIANMELSLQRLDTIVRNFTLHGGSLQELNQSLTKEISELKTLVMGNKDNLTSVFAHLSNLSALMTRFADNATCMCDFNEVKAPRVAKSKNGIGHAALTLSAFSLLTTLFLAVVVYLNRQKIRAHKIEGDFQIKHAKQEVYQAKQENFQQNRQIGGEDTKNFIELGPVEEKKKQRKKSMSSNVTGGAVNLDLHAVEEILRDDIIKEAQTDEGEKLTRNNNNE